VAKKQKVPEDQKIRKELADAYLTIEALLEDRSTMIRYMCAVIRGDIEVWDLEKFVRASFKESNDILGSKNSTKIIRVFRKFKQKAAQKYCDETPGDK
jgi:aminoglycoside/choline kinase family phosphotransferase